VSWQISHLNILIVDEIGL